MRHKFRIWITLGLLMFGLTLTGASLTNISSAEQTNSDMTFSIGISDNAGESKNGAPLLTLKFETGTPSATTIVAKNGTPTLDGQDGDAAWGTASTVSLTAVYGGGGPSQATVKAAYNSENVYFLVTWEDPTETESIHKAMWTYNAGTWSQSGNEDRVYFLWNINAPDFEGNGCTVYCHVGDTEWTAETMMGTNDPGARVDVWHWKAARTNPVNHAEDKYWVDLTEATELIYDSEIELRTRIADLGGGFVSSNKESDLPKYMATNDPSANADFLFEGSVIDFNPSADWQDGDTIPGYIVKNGTGSRADVETVGVYSNGVWTVEFKRALHNGNPDDVSFMPLYASVLKGKVSEQQGTISGLEDQVSEQQTTISGLQGQVTDLQGQVTDLEERVSGLESTTYTYLGGGLIAGLAVGAIIVYAVKRKPT